MDKYTRTILGNENWFWLKLIAKNKHTYAYQSINCSHNREILKLHSICILLKAICIVETEMSVTKTFSEQMLKHGIYILDS